MTEPRVPLIAAATAAALLLAWILFIGLPRWVARSHGPVAAAPAEAVPADPARRIKARLYYVSDDGHGLTSVEHDVPYGADPGTQAREILESQIAPPDAPLVSAIPPGTKLRAVFVANGEAYVDVSGEIVSAHPGGSLNEQLTIYTLVSAVVTNLPAVTGVQILVDGKEVDTLAGHVDLRQPLVQKPDWVQ